MSYLYPPTDDWRDGCQRDHELELARQREQAEIEYFTDFGLDEEIDISTILSDKWEFIASLYWKEATP